MTLMSVFDISSGPGRSRTRAGTPSREPDQAMTGRTSPVACDPSVEDSSPDGRRTRPGSATATTAATATTPAPSQMAGWRPSTYAVGDAYDPFELKTLASTATPNTPPISRIVFVAPDALPSSA